MTQWVVPLKQAVEANGDPFTLITNPSWFSGGSSGTLPPWLVNSSGAYAEYLVSFDEYLRDKYGVAPTFSTIINEAAAQGSTTNLMTPALEAKVIIAMGPMLQAAGLTTKVDMAAGVGPDVSEYYASNAAMTSTVWKYVGAVSWHDYQGTSANKEAVYATASAHDALTTEDECELGTYSTMYDDLTNGNVSYWGQYGMTGYGTGTGIQYINSGVDGASFTLPPQYWNWHQVMHYVRPGAVRIAASNSNSAIQTMAFVQSTGPFVGMTVTMNNTGTTTATEDITGLAPNAKYGVSYALNSALTELGVMTSTSSGGLNVAIPAGAVMTVYPYAGSNMAPEPFSYSANPAYIVLPSAGTTTLSTAATDPQLSKLSYKWELASAPTGATVTFSNSSAATTSASGLTVPGFYNFHLVVANGVRTTTEKLGFWVFAGVQPPIVLAVQSREPSTNLSQPTLLTLPTENSVRLWDQIVYQLQNIPLSYVWSVVSQPTGANARLAADTGPAPPGGDVASNLTVPGSYVFKSAVSNGTETVSQNLTVSVDPAATSAPTITNASGAVTTPGHASLSATVSAGAGDYIVNWWDVLSQPTGSNVTFDNQASPSANATVDTPGTYTFQLSTVDRALSAQSQVISLTFPTVP